MMGERTTRRGGLVGPLVLIGLGVILLLNNLGVVGWDIWWTLLRIWPVFLIAAGIDLLIGRRSVWGSLVTLVLIVAVFAGGIGLAWQPRGGETLASERITEPLGGASRAEVTIGRAVGPVRIEALIDSPNLMEGTARLHKGEKAHRDVQRSGNTAVLKLESTGNFVGVLPTRRQTAGWNLGLNADVPLKLTVNTAVGDNDLDLTGLQVDKLEASVAVGRNAVTLPDEGRLQAKVSGAMGQAIIEIPESMAARIRFSTGLVSRQVPARFKETGDDVFESAGYAGAESRVDLEVSLAMGQVVIR